MSFKFIDLFAGIGGFRLAAEKLNAKCVFSCEIEKNAKKIYKDNFGDEPYPDIRKLNPKEIPDFDVLFAGFPCQPFSIAGKRKGFEDEKNGNLFFYIRYIVQIKKPLVLVLENVRNFLTHDNGNTFNTVKTLLEKLNYKVYADVLNSKFFNLVQSRERVFIVAIHKDYSFEFDFKQLKEHAKKNCKTIVLEDILEEEVDASLFYDGDYIVIKEDIDERIHKPYQIAYVKKGRQGERIYSVKGTSITISHSTGGVFPRTGAYKTSKGIRRLSVNEVKKLFGFPKTYKFEGVSYNKAISLLGNSVPVNVVEAVITPICKNLFNIDKAKVKKISVAKNRDRNKIEQPLVFEI
jgi:DNA (cytosine-5)-methyltransferase 1